MACRGAHRVRPWWMQSQSLPLPSARLLSSYHEHRSSRVTASFTSSPWITSKMAYNREWDKGKQADYGWQAPPRGNHTRDEDFYGDSKRRKYNDGVCSRFPVSGALLSKPFASGLRRVSRVRRFRMG